MKRLAVLLAVLGVAGLASADDTPEDVSAQLEEIRALHDVPALAGAIVDGDAVVALGATGLRKRGAEARVTPQDRWHLGSCTKAMSATVIARLVEGGRLRWDATPEGLSEAMHPDYRKVTLPLLLSHRGGVTGNLGKHAIWGWLWRHVDDPVGGRRKLVRFLLERKPEIPPNTQYLYSNGGYVIAGAIAEQVTGVEWTTLMRGELFEPLGMASADFGVPYGAGPLDQPWGHHADDTPVEPGLTAGNPLAIAPAGTAYATLEDWARFASLHLAAYGGDPALLSRDALLRLHTPREGEDYARGWVVTQRDWADGLALTHSGSNAQWYATIWMAPKRGFAVLSATNQGGDEAGRAADQAAGALIRHHLKLSP